ncbi:unnamed protein product [Rotaria sordida]|uniref:RanBP2-type domain-containing protein n=2 Tax=Rotaria sordida TaxID=392033 RepID=A0A814JY32_9BILA|nr:unnamed protein product [Rotaria sordida]CAF3589976.1 unnamed protein product [Rotaria sordida]
MLRSTSNSSSNSNGPSDTEMYEFIPTINNEDNLNTIQHMESNVSHDTLTNQSHLRQIVLNARCPIILSQNTTPICSKLFHLKKKLKSTRNKLTNHNNNNNQEKNKGYIMVEKFNSDFILLPNDIIDQDVTRYIQYPLTISNTNNPLETQQSLFHSCTSPINDCLHNTFKNVSTQSNVECNLPVVDLLNIYNIQISETMSTQSSCSTNDLNHEYTGINRSLLNDSEYIRAQRLDLELLIMLEIDTSIEHSSLEEDPDDEAEFNRLYDELLRKNFNLKQELKTLQEFELINSPWLCRSCTVINEPYIKTSRDTCVVCESPSPFKCAILTE